MPGQSIKQPYEVSFSQCFFFAAPTHKSLKKGPFSTDQLLASHDHCERHIAFVEEQRDQARGEKEQMRMELAKCEEAMKVSSFSHNSQRVEKRELLKRGRKTMLRNTNGNRNGRVTRKLEINVVQGCNFGTKKRERQGPILTVKDGMTGNAMKDPGCSCIPSC